MTPARAVVGARAGANPAPGAPPPREAPGSADLRDDLEGLALRLRAAIHREDRLDAFLFAAGMLQIAEDALDCEPELLLHVARRLGATPGAGARAGAASARMVARAAGAIAEQHVDPGMRRWTAQLAALVQRLAEGVADPARPMPARSCDAVLDGVHRLPATLRRTAMRRPACFGIFDQHPDDVRELTARFARFAPARRRPLLVLGVRTSGSYLAPLTGAFLRARGYADVTVLTLRPGRRQRAGQRRAMQAVARRGGLALVCDDPPGSGRTVAGVADLLAGRGLDVVLVLAVFGPPRALPRDLAGRPAVLLGQADWAVTARLAPTAVGATVADLLGPAIEIVACERVDDGAPRRVRRHVRAAYRLTVRDRGHRDTTEAWIAVEGVGLGHLGADAAVLHRELEPYLAPLLGVRDGLMYREWLPDRARADRRTPEPARTAQRLAGYVDARARALPLASDRTTGARGERPAWEAASLVLSRAFGRAQPAARVLVVDPAVQGLLRVERPSRVDGSMELSRWFAAGAGDLVKVDWAEPDGASWRVASCDPVSDLAQVTAGSQDRALGRLLREAYNLLGHEPIEAERWLLHELAHLWSHERAAPDDPAPRRAAAVAMQAYMHEVYFADLEPDGNGPLCALDVDGVLELGVLGFPALTPVAAQALRALTAHGHRPVLATGRSEQEVIERCTAYRLAGGVAEYGAVVHAPGAVAQRSLLSGAQMATMERVRESLRGLDGVHTDPRHRHAVRAWRNDDGRRLTRPLDDAELTMTLTRAGATQTRRIHGDAQTDLVPPGVDKGAGVRALAALLGSGGEAAPVVLAVGDGLPDVPVLDLAARPYAPAHAGRAVRRHARTTRRPYTAGVAEAVGALLGHAPGTCPRCRIPEATSGRSLMLALLALREAGLRGLPRRALRVTRP